MVERKYLAHYIDASFGGTTPEYVRLGEDLEDFSEELNPDVEVKHNILGEQKVTHKGYQPQSEVEPYYITTNETLSEKLEEIANGRKTGDACKTTRVDALFTEDGTCVWAYREDVLVVPKSVGGDTSGVQIPFSIYNAGKRVKGTMIVTENSKTFTPDSITPNSNS